MAPFASPIRIPMLRATALHYSLVAAHVITFLGLIRICPHGLHTTLLALLVVASLVLEVLTIGLPERRFKTLVLGGNDEWLLLDADAQRTRARLLAGFFVSSRLVILRVKPSGGCPLHVVLTSANTPHDAFRRLRVRLRYPLSAGGKNQAGFA